MTGTITAATSAESAATIGSGQTTGESAARLCSIHMQAQERAAHIEGQILGDDGTEIWVHGIAAVNPDDGALLLTGPPELSVDLNNNNRLDLTITGPAETVNWRGYLKVAFVYDYAV